MSKATKKTTDKDKEQEEEDEQEAEPTDDEEEEANAITNKLAEVLDRCLYSVIYREDDDDNNEDNEDDGKATPQSWDDAHTCDAGPGKANVILLNCVSPKPSWAKIMKLPFFQLRQSPNRFATSTLGRELARAQVVGLAPGPSAGGCRRWAASGPAQPRFS